MRIEEITKEEYLKHHINSVANKYPKLRQRGKMPSFALQYSGTYKTLIDNGGFSEEEAKHIEEQYHQLYKVFDNWVKDKLEDVAIKGFAELAFGLRLRAPLMNQVIWSSKSKPYESIKESKTIANALTQSYNMLCTRACNEFMERVYQSKWKRDVLPICQVHDALYFLIKNNLDCVKWVNENLIESMTKFVLPEIDHPIVKLEAQMEIYHPSWAHGITIPNNVTQDEIRQIVKNEKN